MAPLGSTSLLKKISSQAAFFDTGFIISGSWGSQSAVPLAHADSLKVAQAEFAVVLAGLKSLAADLAALETAIEGIKAPWTPGRIPDYP